MSDDDQTTPLPREDAPSDRIPTQPVPPDTDPSRMAAGPSGPAPSPARTPIGRRTWVRVTAAVTAGILLVGAGMGIGWGLAGRERGWDLAAQSGPAAHHLEGHGGMPGRDGEGFGPDGQGGMLGRDGEGLGPGGHERGGPGAGRPDRDADADHDGDTPAPAPSTTPAA